MILRVWRAPLHRGAEAELLARLRAIVPKLRGQSLPLDFTYGFRHEAGTTYFLAVSTWPDFESLIEPTGGDLAGTIRDLGVEDLLDAVEAQTFEQLPPVSPRLDEREGRVIAVVTGTVIRGRESVVQSMIDRSAQAALGSGGLAAHVGRRMVGDAVGLLILVVWPKRDTMARFVRSRDIPALDPAFVAHLSEWRFETFGAVSPDGLLVPKDGPAVLVVDGGGRYVEATPGVENVLGVPGELLFGRSILELAGDDEERADLRRRFLETGVSHGMIEVLRPDGRRVALRYRSLADVPAPGLRSSVLSIPSDPEDLRPTAEIVTEALAAPVAELSAGTAAVGSRG